MVGAELLVMIVLLNDIQCIKYGALATVDVKF